MTDLQMVVILMCVMGIVFSWFTKLMFDAFIVHLRRQSDLTTAAVKQAGDAVELNGRILATLASLAGAPAPLPQQQTSGSEIPNNCPQNTTQEKT